MPYDDPSECNQGCDILKKVEQEEGSLKMGIGESPENPEISACPERLVSEAKFDSRFLQIEKRVDSISGHLLTLRSDYQVSLERHSTILERFATKMEDAISFQKTLLEAQRETLPIGQVMRLFLFFFLLVIALTASILGIKWVAFDLLAKI